MSARRRSPGLSQLSMWLGLLLHGALLVSVHLIEDDRWASVAALSSFCGVPGVVPVLAAA